MLDVDRRDRRRCRRRGSRRCPGSASRCAIRARSCARARRRARAPARGGSTASTSISSSSSAPWLAPPPRHDLETLGERRGLGPVVRLEVADHDVAALGLRPAGPPAACGRSCRRRPPFRAGSGSGRALARSLGAEHVVHDQVDQLDPDERQDHAAEPVDQQVAAQQRRRADRPVLDALRASGISAGMISALKMIAEMIALSGVPRFMTLSASSGPRSPGAVGVGEGEDRREDREVLRDVVRDRERRQRATRDQQLLRRPRRSRSASSGSSRGRPCCRPPSRRVVPVFIATPTSACASAGASFVPSPVIATMRPLRLLLADQRHLRLRRRLGEEVVDARLLRRSPRR